MPELLPLIPLLALASIPALAWGVARAPALAGAAALVPLALCAMVLAVPPDTVVAYDWLPALGIAIAFRMDGLARLMALLITGIGAGIFLYAAGYLKGHPQLHRFLAVLALFMAAMLGAVLADDLMLLFVFWEITSLASFLLIGFDAAKSDSRKAAQQGLLVTVGVGLPMLAGILLLGAAAGTFRLSAILAEPGFLAGHAFTPWIVALICAGCFAKSAQFPLHFWLPGAMAAPAPVSAYLHSATMVKLGVFLLARLNPAFQEEVLWLALLTGAGGLTMLSGAVLALRERDLKRKLAWSTVVSLGTLTTLIGLEQPLAATAAVVFLLVHALYKACLFMAVGILDKKAGTRDAMLLSGLGRRMPLTALAALLAGLSMAGIPGFIGSFSKDLVVTAQFGIPGLLPIIALGANAAMVVVAGMVAASPFLGAEMESDRDARDPPWGMLAGPLILGALGLVFGIAPGLISEALIEPAAAAILGRPTEVGLGEKQADTLVGYLSLGALGIGVFTFFGWRHVQPTLAGQRWMDTLGPSRAYEAALAAVGSVSGAVTRRVQTGSLRFYLAATLVLMMGGAALVLVAGGGLAWPSEGPAPRPPQWALAALLVAGAIAACRLRALMAQLMAVGIVGFGMALLFLTLGGADLAFTQFTVEAISLVLLVAILARLPYATDDARDARDRRRDAAIAIGGGVVAAAVLLAVLSAPVDTTIPDWMGRASVPEAKGRNVVNVVLVDFRALDTLGEIAVLLIAAIAAVLLVQRVREGRR